MARGKKASPPAPVVESAAHIAAQLTHDGKPRGYSGGNRPNPARIARVEELVGTIRDAEIVKKVSAEFGCSERTIHEDLVRVRVALAPRAAAANEEMRAYRREQAETAFHQCVENGDLKEARRYLDILCRIDGAYAAESMKILNLDAAAIAQLPDAELGNAIRAELVTMLGTMSKEERALLLAEVEGAA